MKSDDVFYQIFQQSPELAFELMGQTAPCPYQFRAQEVKAFGFRTDGLMFPESNNPNHPIILLEAQMQPDPELYYRILNELTTYLRQYQPPNPWRVMVLYPKRSTERVVPQMEKLLAFCNLYRFYLNELRTGVSLGQDILKLMVSSQTEVQARARELLERAQQQLSEPREQNNFIELLIETVTRIFPEQSKEEIRKMLELVPVTQTRFYREVKQEGHDEGYDEGYDEGHDEGYEEGHDEGREQEARSLILRLLSRRFGEIPPQAQTQIEQLNLEQMESLAEALLDFSAIADLLSWLKQQQAG